MRSDLSCDGQAALPFEVPDAGDAARPRPGRRGRPAVPGLSHRLEHDALGWPAGTDLQLSPCPTPRRGQVVVAREGTRTWVGVFEVQVGRAALRTDHGSVWLGPSVAYLGAVTSAAAPLPGMPAP